MNDFFAIVVRNFQRSVHLFTPDMVLDHQELYSPLGPELRKKVRQTLLKQHHHQNQKKLANRLPIVRSIADISRRTSELHLDKHGENRPPLLLLLGATSQSHSV